MTEAIETFEKTFGFLSKNAILKEPVVEDFVNNVVQRYELYMLVDPTYLGQISADVFGDRKLMEFVTTLSMQFFARWGQSDNDVNSLCNTIARALCLGQSVEPFESTKDNFVGMPDEVAKRFPKGTEASQVLKANRWLVVLFLLPLVLTTKPPAELPA